MQAIEQKIKSYLSTAMGYSALMVALGLILLIFPGTSLNLIRWGLSLGLIILGIWMIITDITRRSILSMFSGSIGGVLSLVMGIVIILYPRILDIIPIILGVWMIVSSTFSLRLTSSLRAVSNNGYLASVITTVISIVCGIILILNPTDSTVALIALIGVMVIVYAAATLIDLFILRKHLQHIAKFVKNNGAIEVKAKEVKTKKK